MSHYAEETYDVYNESCRKARKPHTCSACAETIRVGDYYHVVATVYDGSARTYKRCERCQRIHLHLREAGENFDMWPAERLDCGEEYRDHWGDDPPEEIAALAFATADELQRARTT